MKVDKYMFRYTTTEGIDAEVIVTVLAGSDMDAVEQEFESTYGGTVNKDKKIYVTKI